MLCYYQSFQHLSRCSGGHGRGWERGPWAEAMWALILLEKKRLSYELVFQLCKSPSTASLCQPSIYLVLHPACRLASPWSPKADAECCTCPAPWKRRRLRVSSLDMFCKCRALMWRIRLFQHNFTRDSKKSPTTREPGAVAPYCTMHSRYTIRWIEKNKSNKCSCHSATGIVVIIIIITIIITPFILW